VLVHLVRLVDGIGVHDSSFLLVDLLLLVVLELDALDHLRLNVLQLCDESRIVDALVSAGSLVVLLLLARL